MPYGTQAGTLSGRGRWVVLVLAMAGAWLLGTQMQDNTALAQDGSSESPTANQIANAMANGHLSLQDIIIDRAVPPAAVLPSKEAFAIVGAADGRYYLVDCQGVAIPVRGDRRFDLFWRPDPAAAAEDERIIIVP